MCSMYNVAFSSMEVQNLHFPEAIQSVGDCPFNALVNVQRVARDGLVKRTGEHCPRVLHNSTILSELPAVPIPELFFHTSWLVHNLRFRRYFVPHISLWCPPFTKQTKYAICIKISNRLCGGSCRGLYEATESSSTLLKPPAYVQTSSDTVVSSHLPLTRMRRRKGLSLNSTHQVL